MKISKTEVKLKTEETISRIFNESVEKVIKDITDTRRILIEGKSEEDEEDEEEDKEDDDGENVITRKSKKKVKVVKDYGDKDDTETA